MLLTLKILKGLNLLPLGGPVPSGAYIARPLLLAWLLIKKIFLFLMFFFPISFIFTFHFHINFILVIHYWLKIFQLNFTNPTWIVLKGGMCRLTLRASGGLNIRRIKACNTFLESWRPTNINSEKKQKDSFEILGEIPVQSFQTMLRPVTTPYPG